MRKPSVCKNSFRLALAITATFALLACGRGTAPGISQTHAQGIIGGTNAVAGTGGFGSIVAIEDLATGDLCSGSLLEGNIVLTAAHCLDKSVAHLRVFFGASVDQGSVMRTVDFALAHSGYNENADTDENDIGLVHFTGTLPSGFFPATLLRDSSLLKNKVTVLLAGYGISNARAGSGDGLLRSVSVSIKDAAFGKGEISLDQSAGKGSCGGDSGGPAYLSVGGQLLLWGVTSRGDSTERIDLCNHDSIYTNAAAFLDWISVNSVALRAHGNGSVHARNLR